LLWWLAVFEFIFQELLAGAVFISIDGFLDIVFLNILDLLRNSLFIDKFGVVAYKIVVGLIEILRAAAFVNDKPDRLMVSIFAGDGHGLVFFF
jgi:hypothetical protein